MIQLIRIKNSDIKEFRQRIEVAIPDDDHTRQAKSSGLLRGIYRSQIITMSTLEELLKNLPATE